MAAAPTRQIWLELEDDGGGAEAARGCTAGAEYDDGAE
jgi:hypothetical protein